MTLAPRLLTVSAAPTAHRLGVARNDVFDDLPAALRDVVIPLALLDGTALGPHRLHCFCQQTDLRQIRRRLARRAAEAMIAAG